MSYLALATDRFDEVARFYGELLGFPIVEQWDRPHGRGRRFDLGGIRLEVLDNQRKRQPLSLGKPDDRAHIVIEVEDIEGARRNIRIEAPPTQHTSWGAHLFQTRDPDGVPVTFLQWVAAEEAGVQNIHGRVVSGEGRGKYFSRLDWACRQFIDKLGIDPYPGTVNLTVADPASKSAWDRLKSMPGMQIANPGDGPNECDARCFPVSIEGVGDAAIVLPEVGGYSPDQIEVIATSGIRSALGIGDGDLLTLAIKTDRTGKIQIRSES